MDTSMPNQYLNFQEPSSGSQSGLSVFQIIIIVLIIALLGINIFVYLAEITDTTIDILKPILEYLAKTLGYTLIDTSKTTIDIATEGSKLGIDIAGGAVKSGIDVTEDIILPNGETYKMKSNNTSNNNNNVNNSNIKNSEKIEDENEYSDDEENNEVIQKINYTSRTTKKNQKVQNDTSGSSTQSTGKKQGWCFIGEDRGIRSCIRLDDPNQCMSGDLFPSKDVCINPNLRY